MKIKLLENDKIIEVPAYWKWHLVEGKKVIIDQNKKNIAIVEYERDIAWDGIRNLEEACLKGVKGIGKILFYLENAKRIKRDTLANMLEEVQDDINPNYIEY